MSITFNNPINGPTPSKTPQKDSKPSPQDRQEDFKKKNLLKQQKNINDQLKKLSISTHIRDLANKLAASPNDDPRGLYNQIRTLLADIKISNLIDAGKTKLIIGETDNRGNSLYCIQFRRNSEIVMDIINRIKRQEKSFDSIKWSSKAMEIYLWWPYKAPEETNLTGR